MATDRYIKIVLTVIACELLWLGLRESAPPVQAQAAPTPVVITGIDIDRADAGYVPVVIAGMTAQVPQAYGPFVTGLRAQVEVDSRRPVRITTAEALTVQTTPGRPLLVESIPARPGERPGM